MATTKTAAKTSEKTVKKTDANVTAASTPKTSKKPVKSTAKADGFAIIATGGKQYQVAVGETVKIEKLKGKDGVEYKKGDAVIFDSVLLTNAGLDIVIGTPSINGATVTGEIVDIARAQKVTVLKYKQKSRYQKKNGHRQPYFAVKITAIA